MLRSTLSRRQESFRDIRQCKDRDRFQRARNQTRTRHREDIALPPTGDPASPLGELSLCPHLSFEELRRELERLR